MQAKKAEIYEVKYSKIVIVIGYFLLYRYFETLVLKLFKDIVLKSYGITSNLKITFHCMILIEVH